ncbi:ComF family protein [Gillisia sp. M10.2A]|uniref:ComF family protein n=1 Tax=Gillisia lutea TaxID=2909668 RepID=A0ABS9EC77_9FLAO|nr:phosphoribosyltransferase family protein [Gillisia lutea]MCF4100489.1 ComF family protein [Gillisia lutea]
MFHDLINLFYPESCAICGSNLAKNEHIMCVLCLHDIPVTNYHLDNDNPVKKVFYGRVEIENACELLLFRKKGAVQKLIHELKYKGRQEVGVFLGNWLGTELSMLPKYKEIDVVIPVPLHKIKQRERGYNQVEGFGKQLATSLNIPYLDNVLFKTSVSGSQTIKARFARWGTIEETLIMKNPDLITNKHILLVDDLVTTGATLEACANVLKKASGVKISIATMAYTG